MTTAVIGWSPAILAQNELLCGSLTANYGPYDYTNALHRAEKLKVVEDYHYDVGVQSLKGSDLVENSFDRLGADIEYTLIAFPNHHPALYTMIRYYLELVPNGEPKMTYEPICWFERAKRIAPDDATVLMLEGIYFQKVNRLDQAKQSYDSALELDPESAEINYNAGLLYLNLQDYDSAKSYAKRAYALGYPLPGLRKKLMKLGVW